jgi:hypothetical protein
MGVLGAGKGLSDGHDLNEVLNPAQVRCVSGVEPSGVGVGGGRDQDVHDS